MRLYTRYQNSAGERVRIALNLKGVPYDYVSISAMEPEDYRALNPQGLMPALDVAGAIIAQSSAILEYLEETYPKPALLPADPVARAQVRAFGQLITADMHPLNNNRVRVYLSENLGMSRAKVAQWNNHWMAEGFTALETTLANRAAAAEFAFGDSPGWAELHLVPQWRNAVRYGCNLEPFPLLRALAERCMALEAFARAAPEQQPDFPTAS